MSTEYRCGKCGSAMLRVYQDGSGFCLECNSAFENIDALATHTQHSNVDMGSASEPFRYEFIYTLERKEIESGIKLCLKAKEPGAKKSVIFVLLLLLLFVALDVFITGKITKETVVILLFVIVFIGFIFDIPLKLMIREKPDDYLLNKAVRLIVDKEQIELKDKDIESVLSWRAIQYILKDKRGSCFVMIDGTAIIIPGRLFQSNEDFETFIQKSREQRAIAWSDPWISSFNNIDTQIRGEDWTGGPEPFNYAFSFTLTKKDLKTYWSYSALNYTYKRKSLLYAAVVLSIMLLFIIMLPVSKDTQSFLLFAWAVGLIFQIAISFNAIDRTRIKSRPFEYGVDIPRILIFNTESFIVKLAEGIYNFPLSSIELIHETREYAYFFLHSRRALILPRRVFKKELEYDVFIKMMKEVHARIAKPRIEN